MVALHGRQQNKKEVVGKSDVDVKGFVRKNITNVPRR